MTTKLGKKLSDIRGRAIAKGMSLMSEDEILEKRSERLVGGEMTNTISDRLPCGHDYFTVLHEQKGIFMVRCATCKKLWVIMQDNSFIPVDSVFTIKDLKDKDAIEVDLEYKIEDDNHD